MGMVVKTEALIFIYLNSIFGGVQVLVGRALLDTAQCDISTSGELSISCSSSLGFGPATQDPES